MTFYDQSGNGNNLGESTAILQPKIIDNGVIYRRNNFPSIYFGPAGGAIKLTGAYTFAQPTTHFMVGQSDGTNNYHFLDGSTTRQLIGYSGGNYVIFAGAVVTITATSNATNFQLMTTLFNGASSKGKINAGSFVTGNAGSNSLNGILLGTGNPGGAQSINGYISEWVIYTTDQSGTTGINSNINTYYSIY